MKIRNYRNAKIRKADFGKEVPFLSLYPYQSNVISIFQTLQCTLIALKFQKASEQ